MATEKTLADAFHETLKDVYFAEKASVRALKKSAKAAQSAELKQAFEHHQEESGDAGRTAHRDLRNHRQPARAKTCDAMQGLTSEMEDDLEDFGGSPAADDVLIGCAQAMEHYEIARYGLLKTWAGKLGYDDAVKLLDLTLQEEKKADELLSEIADGLETTTGAATAAPAKKPTVGRKATAKRLDACVPQATARRSLPTSSDVPAGARFAHRPVRDHVLCDDRVLAAAASNPTARSDDPRVENAYARVRLSSGPAGHTLAHRRYCTSQTSDLRALCGRTGDAHPPAGAHAAGAGP